MKSIQQMQETAINMAKGAVDPKELLRLELLTSLEKYTKCMFRAQYHRSFIVAEHHKKIIDLLQKVVDGDCKRLIINIAPRYGKCLAPDTLVTMANYTTKPLCEIVPGDKVLSFHNGEIVSNRVIATEPAYKECYKLTTASGRTVVCSIDHPWLTVYGYLQANKIPARTNIYCLDYNAKTFGLDSLKSKEPIGYQNLIHIEVENDHNFIANGLVSHNTELVVKSFISWCFALNPKCRFMHLSYSDFLVNDNSETIRAAMSLDLYKTLFPKSALESEKGSTKRWKTKAGGELYAVSTQGQVTGLGAGAVDPDPELDLMDGGNDIFVFDDKTNEMLRMIGARSNVFNGAIVIDDPIKPEDANSDIVRERVNMRFENTIRNRVNSRNTPIIIIMQRLHEHDLCGYLQEVEPNEWTVLSLPVIQEDPETGEEHALWPMKHTIEELHKMREINPLVFDTQYMQDPTPREGLMYENFRTYRSDELPTGNKAIQKWNYTDTADTGADHLCSICFINTPEYCYVTDVLFTDAPMEVTEPKLAKMLAKNGTVETLIESNNGGRGFARNVKRILRVDLKSFKCAVRTFTQTENKKTRIFTASANVQTDILFPDGWDKMWPKFYQALTSYRKDNKKKNQHDDAPDALTGVYELHARKQGRRKIHRRN